MWIWDRPGWPEWDYALRADTVRVLKDIHTRREQLAKESGQAPELVARAVKGALLREASSTSEIEGEHIPYDDLRNVVAGVDPAEDADPRAAGVVGMLEACRAPPVLHRHTLFDRHERSNRSQSVSASQQAPHWRGRCRLRSLTLMRTVSQSNSGASRSSANSAIGTAPESPRNTSIDRHQAARWLSLISPR